MTEQQRQDVVQRLKDEERTRCEIWFDLRGYTNYGNQIQNHDLKRDSNNNTQKNMDSELW